MRDYQEARKLFLEGCGIKEISRKTGINRDSVRNYLHRSGLREKLPAPIYKSKEEKTFTCIHCGIVYVNKRFCGEGEKFCSRFCYDEYRKEQTKNKEVVVKKSICKVCNKDFEMTKEYNRNICSDKCRKENERKLSYDAWLRSKEKNTKTMQSVCKECGKTFIYEVQAREREIKFCSKECRKRACGRIAKHRRRLVMQEVKSEHISIAYLMKKYHKECQICGCKVHRSNGKDWSPDIATIDHIIPVTRGGTHTYDNVQLLCAMCNTRKSNNMDGIQLSLFTEVVS